MMVHLLLVQRLLIDLDHALLVVIRVQQTLELFRPFFSLHDVVVVLVDEIQPLVGRIETQALPAH